MDRFKFRVWNNVDFLYEDSDDLFSYCIRPDGTLHLTEDGGCDININEGKFNIEQCTGEKDKNGTLIYENDLIGYIDSQGVQRFHIVKYDSSQCCYVALLDINKDDDISFACRCDEQWLLRKEIIGNIHTNKELLEG